MQCLHLPLMVLVSGLQVYIKSGETVTWLHDDLLWCAALNYMLKESQGCALWIAVGLHDLKQVMSLNEIERLFLSGPCVGTKWPA